MSGCRKESSLHCIACFFSSLTRGAELVHTSLKWTSCMPTSSIMAASSSMFGVMTRNAEQPCLIIPANVKGAFERNKL